MTSGKAKYATKIIAADLYSAVNVQAKKNTSENTQQNGGLFWHQNDV